jgi:dihydroorotate dehydrogenase electron transfer subunit
MREFLNNGRIISNTAAQAGSYLMSLRLPRDFETPLPGQFVMIRLKGRRDMLLARPFSVSGFERDAKESRIEILYRVVGQGTRLFAQLDSGQELDISGPLGRPFEIPQNVKNVILVSGGVGVAPLRYLLACLQARRTGAAPRIAFYIGAKTADELPDTTSVRSCCDDLQVCTDDCTSGYPGRVTEPLESALESYPPDNTLICACGPLGMIRRLSEILTSNTIGCQVSLEERMACGIGACLGCAVAVRGQNGQRLYQRVCREGPVFDLRDILWE